MFWLDGRPAPRACSHYWGGWRCERKSGQTRGPRGQAFVRGVETKPSPKAVAGPLSWTRMKYGPIFAATLRAGANFPHFVVPRR